MKLFNDPVHGFIEVPDTLLALIDHPYVQRLRHIQQMGLTHLVYPGAVHTRFSHALGTMHLTRQALRVLTEKGVEISPEECEATLIASLLHDVGHGPFSHTLERQLIWGRSHEQIGLAIIRRLEATLGERMVLARAIWVGNHPKHYLHQLISGQLDTDRMDYLMRDSFFTGVTEGIIGTERIIKLLAVANGRLVVEQKGIYSVEKFIIARRLMYWQVYLHKAALAAEVMLQHLINRARILYREGTTLQVSDELAGLFYHAQESEEALPPEILDHFLTLNDHDIYWHLKQWQYAQDSIIAELSQRLLYRRLLKLRFIREPVSETELEKLKDHYQKKLGYSETTVGEFVFTGEAVNLAYSHSIGEDIQILNKDGSVQDILSAADLANLTALSEKVTKYYLCTPD